MHFSWLELIMPKLIINSNSINNLEITDDFLDIQLSEHSSYFAGGLFSFVPQRLHFRFYGTDWPLLTTKEIKKVQYYENIDDTEPEFTGWSKYVKPSNNTEEYELVFYDILEKVNTVGEIDIGSGYTSIEDERLTPAEWLARIESRSGNFPVMDVDINTSAMQAHAVIKVAEYKPSYTASTLASSYVTNLWGAFSLNLNPLYPLISTEIYLKFNEINGIRYLIVIKKYNHAYDSSTIDTTWAYGWKITIFTITDLIVTNQISTASYWEVVGQTNEQWTKFINNQGDFGIYHSGWLDSLDIGDGVYNSLITGNYIDDGGNLVFYSSTTFPFTLVDADRYYWENIKRIVVNYAGDIVLDQLTLHYERDDDDILITEKLVDYKDIIAEILKLTNSMMYAGIDGSLKIRNRLAIEGNIIDVDADECEELPQEEPLDISEKISIPDTFLANDHPITLALIDYYKELNDSLENSRKIIYFGEIKPRLNYKFRIDGVDVSEKIVAMLPVNTSTENYKEITVWQVASEGATDETTSDLMWTDGIWDNDIIWNNRAEWRNA